MMKRLITSTILYMVIALIASMVAISQNLPAEIGGYTSGRSITQEFIYGIGTALSPPLYTLIIQFVLLLLTPRKDGWGTTGVLGLMLIGLMTCIGALSEPINRRIFNPATFDPVKAIIMAGMILLPLAIVAFGLMEWLGRRHSK
jgi:hypothetical protein